MIKRIGGLLAIIILLWAHPILAASTFGNGKIEGTVVNKTASAIVPDLSVNLEIYQNDAKIETIAGKIINSKFSFEGLSVEQTFSYVITTTYQEVEYRTSNIKFAAGQSSQTAELDIFEPTTDEKVISVMMSNVIVSYNNNSLYLKEYYLFANMSDRAYIGQISSSTSGKRAVVKFSLPPGATGFQINFGLSSIIHNGVDFADSTPILPGLREVSYSYTLPCNTDKYSLNWKVNYAMVRFDLLFPDQKIQVSGNNINPEEPLSISGSIYKDYSSKNLAPGDIIQANLAGLGGTAGGNNFNPAWIVLIIGVFCIVFVIVFIVRKKSKLTLVNNVDSSLKEKLLSEIAELDDNFENGNIKKDEYLALRNQKKQKLVQLNKMEQKEKAVR